MESFLIPKDASRLSFNIVEGSFPVTTIGQVSFSPTFAAAAKPHASDIPFPLTGPFL